MQVVFKGLSSKVEKFASLTCRIIIDYRIRMLVRQLRRVCVRAVRSNTRSCTSIKNHPGRYENYRSPVFEELVSKYKNTDLLTKLFQENAAFRHSDMYFWDTFIRTLCEHSFKTRDCLQIIRRFPTALGFSDKKLTLALREWSLHSKLQQESLVFLLLNRPELLDADPINIRRRVPFLISNTESKEGLMCLLILCPNLLYDNWEEILHKMNFIISDMVVYKSELVMSRALSKTMEHIQLRFSTLEKCGVYKRPNAYSHKQTKKERLMLRNPKLWQITDTSDKEFARRIANITLEEYKVFEDLFKSNDDVGDSDTDDD